MDEYIDRETAIKLLEEHDGNFSDVEGQWWSHGLNAAISHIKELPAADVAPVVHGTWLESISMEPAFGGGFMPRRTYFCSECGMREKIKWPYCHCGAKMDGGMEDV